jgi:P27 family predicted phage terminase small subunit
MKRPAPAPPPPPPHLDDQGRAKWVEVIGLLLARGDVLDAGILTAVGCYCQAWAQWAQASAKVQELGLITKSPAGFPQENPYAVVARKAQTELRRWGEQLQLTPKTKRSSRKAEGEPSAVASILRVMNDGGKQKRA